MILLVLQVLPARRPRILTVQHLLQGQIFLLMVYRILSFLILGILPQTERELLQHPRQRRLLVDHPDLVPSAVEEMLRWCGVVTHMVRTATRDVVIRDFSYQPTIDHFLRAMGAYLKGISS